ncbi:MAG: hypothetical protein GX265_00565 [Mollicutes bacterium]|jgi:uncharacterized membrane protein|nr:hypothetical protein [Mollicutes bacterium]
MSKRILIIFALSLLFIPSFTVLAEDDYVATFCTCFYDKDANTIACHTCKEDNPNCKPCSDTAKIKEELQAKCGGSDAELTSDIKYFCEPLNSPMKSFISIDADRIRLVPFDSCQYFLMHSTKSYENSDLQVAAFSTCIAPSEIMGTDICKEDDIIKALTFIGYLLFFVKLLVPFIIILIGTMDYYKSVTASKDDSLKEQTQKFLKRIVIGILVFFIPTIINTFLVFFSNYSETIAGFQQCTECLLDPISCDK